jgi:hypothetical protein
MKKQMKILPILALTLFITGCDDGKVWPADIEEEGGPRVTASVSFRGLDAWPENYSLVFAAFDDSRKAPVLSKMISRPSSESEKVTINLNGLPPTTTSLSIAVVNKGREPVYTYYSYAYIPKDDELTLPVSEINLASFDRVQQHVFNTYCTRCHGAGNEAAAGLYLIEGKSYEAIVNKPATRSSEGKMLIEPNQPGLSFLPEVLSLDIINYNHTDVLPEAELITLIETWIKEGAEK